MEREIPVEENDHYGLLEVDPSASKEVIVAAFEVLHSKEDGLQTARQRAKNVLLDDEQRAEYDQSLIDGFYGQGNIGNYKLLQKISENGFSRTYSAQHLETGMLVWITQVKKLSPRSIRILKEEAIKSWDLRTYSIPTVRDFFKIPNGQYVLVTSSIPGKTIDQYVLENGKVDPIDVGWILDRSFKALSFLYDSQRVHGGINPRNVIMQYNHAVVLIGSNFAGVSTEMIGADEEYAKVFMSPEQIANERLWPEADFFSLGATAIFALTGDIEMVKRKQLPDFVPAPMRQFIRRLIKSGGEYRPRWIDEGGDLIETLRNVRIESFGSDNTNQRIVPGLSQEI